MPLAQDAGNEIDRLPRRTRANSSRLLFDDIFFGDFEDDRENGASCDCGTCPYSAYPVWKR